MNGYYKVPGRDVYCDTLRGWLASVVVCHIFYRLAPPKLPKL